MLFKSDNQGLTPKHLTPNIPDQGYNSFFEDKNINNL